jgi:predicted helicase
MPVLSLKPTHKPIKAYYASLEQMASHGATKEGSVKYAFAGLLRHCAAERQLTLIEEFTVKVNSHTISLDGALLDPFKLRHGAWEAKDSKDDLPKEIAKKFAKGYPRDNILFQEPRRAILIQNGAQQLDADLTQPTALIDALEAFFTWQSPPIEQWQKAVADFKPLIPDLAKGVLALIEKERRENKRFIAAFEQFLAVCRAAINPNLAVAAVEEMLIQHLLTERVFRTVFKNSDFAHNNAVAAEIEQVITALTSRQFSRDTFLKPLDKFYVAIETTAALFDDYAEKQSFLNTIYEQFFQGFAVKVADTHGIVYTPQPIVDFMVRGVDELLQTHFKKSLATPGVHVLDPFVGTGNFLLRVMRQLPKTALADKFAGELHANEVMLLPYYVASMNLEHAYYEATGQYRPFQGLCLVDTFELAEAKQPELFGEANTARVEAQKQAPIFVIISNPPYNAHQVNENDNNKNRKYPVVDQRVRETYARHSKAQLKSALSDAYVKAFRWASDRIGDEGIVAFVSNNSFLEDLAFDGMRQSLAKEFAEVYLVNLRGNVRRNPKIAGTTHNVFGIQVGVCITFLVKHKGAKTPGKLFYADTDEFWVKEQRLHTLADWGTVKGVPWQQLAPDARHTWLTAGLRSEFADFLPLTKRQAMHGGMQDSTFSTVGTGIMSGRDSWVYGFHPEALLSRVSRTAETYNAHVAKWQAKSGKRDVDQFVLYDETKISWSRNLKRQLVRGAVIEADRKRIRRVLYRPFCLKHLYCDSVLVDERGIVSDAFPLVESEVATNLAIWLKSGPAWPFFALCTRVPCDFLPQGGSRIMPLYTYSEDGSNRVDNITTWALEQFRAHYGDAAITREEIFHYVYGLLHHPAYRERYAADLKRDLPRIPFAPDFRAFATAGRQLADLHVHYEQQPEYDLQLIEEPDTQLDLRVTRMRLSKDKTAIVYNDFLTLAGIPPEVFAYRLGHKSALEWVLDQYQVTTDPRSGIVNDPNQPDDEYYILRLIRKVITVSLRTQELVAALPAWEPTP